MADNPKLGAGQAAGILASAVIENNVDGCVRNTGNRIHIEVGSDKTVARRRDAGRICRPSHWQEYHSNNRRPDRCRRSFSTLGRPA